MFPGAVVGTKTNGGQPWDARPMSTLKGLDGNPGFDPEVDVEKEVYTKEYIKQSTL